VSADVFPEGLAVIDALASFFLAAATAAFV
jgi:hypothetical protein